MRYREWSLSIDFRFAWQPEREKKVSGVDSRLAVHPTIQPCVQLSPREKGGTRETNESRPILFLFSFDFIF